MNHGVYVREQATSVGTPVVAESGVPFVVGLAPVHTAEAPAKAGVPVLCTSWAEAVEKLGYSDNWSTYTLCEFMYSHFKLYGAQPVIFYNVLDPATMTTPVAAREYAVTDRKVKLPCAAVNNATLIVAAEGASEMTTLAKGTDYDAFYDGNNLVVELLAGSAHKDATSLNIAYAAVDTSGVDAADIAAGVEGVELCMTTLGIVPDLICAPGFSHLSAVAAVMATKAGSVNGLFKCKALIDVDTTTATAYAQVKTAKDAANLHDATEIICWPMCKLGDYQFHLSTQIAGLMASVDTGNGGAPFESPGNKGLKIDGLCLANGTEVFLTHSQANILNGNGVMTALNFMGGWVAWGNWTACYPENTDVKDYFIPVSRMFGWVGNTLVKTFWSRLDKPMTRLLIDSVLDTANIWLSGLVGSGYLLGGRVEMLDSENPETNLMAGIIKLHVYITPPSPAVEINFVLEYDASYVKSALQG